MEARLGGKRWRGLEFAAEGVLLSARFIYGSHQVNARK